MVRTFLGTLVALTGASAAVWSPFRPWYGGRRGADIRVEGLFTGVGVTPHDAPLPGSLLLPMGFAALLAALGVLMRARYVLAPAGLLVLGVTVLWMVRQAQFDGSLTAGGDGLDVGVAFALIGGLLLLAGACLLPGPRALRFAKAAPVGRYGGAPPIPAPVLAPATAPFDIAEPPPAEDGGAPTLVGIPALPDATVPLPAPDGGGPAYGLGPPHGMPDEPGPPDGTGQPNGSGPPYEPDPPYEPGRP